MFDGNDNRYAKRAVKAANEFACTDRQRYFGGFLGLGQEYYPVPWSTLTYDTNLGGYRTDLDADRLQGAPKYSQSTGWNWSRENDQRVYDYSLGPAR